MTETNNDRISEFTAVGSFVRAFGVDVDSGGGTGFETCTTECQAGDSGDPAGVAVTASGEVYVTNPGEDNVGRYSSAGVFLGAFAGDGSGAGTIVNAQSVDVSASGEVLVTQSADAHAIFRFLSGPVFLESFVPGPAVTDQPTDAAFGIDGSAYVAQRGLDRVVRYGLGASSGPPPMVPAPAPHRHPHRSPRNPRSHDRAASEGRVGDRPAIRQTVREPPELPDPSQAAEGLQAQERDREPQWQARRDAIGQAADRAGRPARAAQRVASRSRSPSR